MIPYACYPLVMGKVFPIISETIFGKPCCVFVFEPLNVIIQQQLSKLGLYATCLKEKNDAAVLDKLKTGDYTYIYTHPEHMIGKNPHI